VRNKDDESNRIGGVRYRIMTAGPTPYEIAVKQKQYRNISCHCGCLDTGSIPRRQDWAARTSGTPRPSLHALTRTYPCVVVQKQARNTYAMTQINSAYLHAGFSPHVLLGDACWHHSPSAILPGEMTHRREMSWRIAAEKLSKHVLPHIFMVQGRRGCSERQVIWSHG
jgi:hypothetical protein